MVQLSRDRWIDGLHIVNESPKRQIAYLYIDSDLKSSILSLCCSIPILSPLSLALSSIEKKITSAIDEKISVHIFHLR